MIFMIVVSKQRTYELGTQKNQRHVDIDSKEERSERFQLMMKEKGIKGKKQRGEYAHEKVYGVCVPSGSVAMSCFRWFRNNDQPRRIATGFCVWLERVPSFPLPLHRVHHYYWRRAICSKRDDETDRGVEWSPMVIK